MPFGAPSRGVTMHIVSSLQGASSPEQGRVPVRIADQVVRTLAEVGVERVFGIPGGAISGVYDALIDANIETLVCQHEGMAAYLAYGHARATGKPAVVAVTSGPGILNAVTGVASAYTDEVPMIVLTGDVRTPLNGMGALQDGGPGGIDIVGVMRSFTKLSDSVIQPQRASALVAQAADVAMAHPRGPTFLRLPLDTTTAALPTMQVRQALAGVGTPDAEVCDRIARELLRARRPVIFLGLGARTAAVGALVKQIAEHVRCPVVTDIEAKGVFPESHGLSLGLYGVGGSAAASAYLEHGADFVLAIGARFDDTTTNGYSADLRPQNGVLIQLDHNAHRICRAYDADVAMACDLDLTLQAVASRLGQPSVPTILSRDKAIADAKSAEPRQFHVVMRQAPHDPGAVVRVMQSALPADTVFTSDIGNHMLAAARNLVIDRPDAFHASIGTAGMGSGIGMAMGMALAYGSTRRVVGICGDGSFRMVGTEIATCAKYRIPVTLAVFDDAQLGMIEQGHQALYGRSTWAASPSVDVVAFARSLGAEAVSIQNEADLRAALATPRSGPLVLHVPIDANVRHHNARVTALSARRE